MHLAFRWCIRVQQKILTILHKISFNLLKNSLLNLKNKPLRVFENHAWKSIFRVKNRPKSILTPKNIIKWSMSKKVFSSRLEPSTPRNRQKPVFDFVRPTFLRKFQNQAMVLKKKFFLIFSSIDCVQVKCSSTSRNVRIVITNFDQFQKITQGPKICDGHSAVSRGARAL